MMHVFGIIFQLPAALSTTEMYFLPLILCDYLQVINTAACTCKKANVSSMDNRFDGFYFYFKRCIG